MFGRYLRCKNTSTVSSILNLRWKRRVELIFENLYLRDHSTELVDLLHEFFLDSRDFFAACLHTTRTHGHLCTHTHTHKHTHGVSIKVLKPTTCLRHVFTTQSLAHIRTNTHTHTHTRWLASRCCHLRLPCCMPRLHSHTRSLANTRTRTRTHTHTHTNSRTHTYTHTNISPTHTHDFSVSVRVGAWEYEICAHANKRSHANTLITMHPPTFTHNYTHTQYAQTL